MAFQAFTITGKNNSENFQVNGPNEEVRKFCDAFLSLFPGMVDMEQQVVRPGILTHDQRIAIDAFIAKGAGQLPQLNRISALFRKFEDNEIFFVFPFVEIPQIEPFMVHSAIDSLNSGKDHKEEFNKILELFGDVFNDYRLGTYGHIRAAVGEGNRAKRMCRFCSNTRIPLTFHQRAHAISEALGNKTIILHDECDGCNAEFSKSTEQDIIEFYSFFRAVHGIKGKGGLKEYEGTNFKISRKNGPLTIEFHSTEDEPKEALSDNNHFDIKLISKKEISKQNIYRCLCKYFLSVIPAQQLIHFTKTIEWINGKFDADKLPPAIKFNYYGWFREQPTMTVYIRTSGEKSIPFAVGEFQFGHTKTAFIVPFCSEDDLTYTNKEEFERFMEKFKHYRTAPGPQLENLSDNAKRTFQINLKINGPEIKNNEPLQDSSSNPG